MTTRDDLLDQLATYVAEVASSADVTITAADRPVYANCLAEAARMFALVRGGGILAELREIVERQRRAAGWTFLSGEEGARAEAAMARFAEFVDGVEGLE